MLRLSMYTVYTILLHLLMFCNPHHYLFLEKMPTHQQQARVSVSLFPLPEWTIIILKIYIC